MTRSRGAVRRLAPLGMVAVLSLSLASCAESQRGSDTAKEGGTLTFASTAAPKLFDPFYATDGETFRVTRQIFDNLVMFKQGTKTAELEPGLAEKWEHTPDGREWTFTLRKGVKFIDDTPFNAEAACKNFERWYGQTGAGTSQGVTDYYQDNFGGFKGQDTPSLYESCTAKDESTVVVRITRSTSKFPDLLALPSFAMQSPTAMEKHNANGVTQQGESFVYPAYANEHPTGTGPFKFSGFDKANGTIELVRNEGYWGTKAKLDKLIYKIIPDETARKQALQSGSVQGYDFPSPADWAALKKDYNLHIRPAFNIFYVGITQKNNPKLTDLRVRKALAHAIDKEKIVKSQLPEGATVASHFFPDTLPGYNTDLKPIAYDPELAKRLLAEAGASNLSIKFYWPSEVTRPYMPNPRDLYGSISRDLEAVGIKLEAVTKPWNGGYLTEVDQAMADMFMLGWTGDYGTPDNFLSSFFGTTDNRMWTQAAPWGQQLTDEIKAADGEPDAAKRAEMYKVLSKKLVEEYLPAIPISHSPPAIVTAKNVTGLKPSPLTDERWVGVGFAS